MDELHIRVHRHTYTYMADGIQFIRIVYAVGIYVAPQTQINFNKIPFDRAFVIRISYELCISAHARHTLTQTHTRTYPLTITPRWMNMPYKQLDAFT